MNGNFSQWVGLGRWIAAGVNYRLLQGMLDWAVVLPVGRGNQSCA